MEEAHSTGTAGESSQETPVQLPWFVLPGFVNIYPKMESEKLIDELFNPAMRVLAPGFRDVRTIGTLRDEHILWTPDIGAGRVVSRHWALYTHTGYSAGKVRTKADDTSIFLVPLHTDFEIYRSAAYLGVCADYFPFGMPERRHYDGWSDRLRNTKPSVGFRLTESRSEYRAKVKADFPLFKLFRVEMDDTWWVTTSNINVGADVPLNRNSALTFNLGYNRAFSRGEDFDGFAFTVCLKRYLK